ncbi:MAG: hypothetical protein AB7P04_04925 [Bacteriovoracia bacterium]
MPLALFFSLLIAAFWGGTGDARESKVLFVDPPAPRRAPPPTAPGPGALTAEDAAVLELQKMAEERRRKLAELSVTSPGSSAVGVVDASGAAATPAPTSLTPEQQKMAETAKRVMENPALQAYFKAVTHPEVINGISKIVGHPSRFTLLMLQVFSLIALMFLRAWRYSKLEKGQWLQRVWIQAWTGVVFLICVLVVWPTLILGPTYREAVGNIRAGLQASP